MSLGIDVEILQQRVTLYGAVDVGFFLGVEVDALGVAAALEVEHPIVIPPVLVVAYEVAFWVGA